MTAARKQDAEIDAYVRGFTEGQQTQWVQFALVFFAGFGTCLFFAVL